MPTNEQNTKQDVGAAVVSHRIHPLQRALFLFASVCWLVIGLGFGLFLLEYLFQGAGIRIFGISVSLVSVAIGVVHFTGLLLAMLFSLALGI